MKVKELIEILQKLDQEKEIKRLNSDYEQGETPIEIQEVKYKEEDEEPFAYRNDGEFYYIE